MVAKSLFTAAFLLSCTLAWGECPNGKCSSGECESPECQSGEYSASECTEGECTKCCAEGDCSEEECAKTECSLGKCSKGECSKSECAAAKCSKGECAQGECSKSKCSVAKCTRDESAEDCCAGEGCALAKCASDAYASLKCAVGACATTCSDGECSDSTCSVAEKCSDDDKCCEKKRCSGDKLSVFNDCSEGNCCPNETCATSKCATEECAEKCVTGACSTIACAKGGCAKAACGDHRIAAEIQEINATVERIQQLNQQVAELRRNLDHRRASLKPERMNVSITLVEINRTKCRNLGIEFDFTDASPQSQEVQELVAALESNGLARVIATGAREVNDDESALIGIDASYQVTEAGEVRETKSYPDVEVKPISSGDCRVSVLVRPTSCERGGAFGTDSQTSLAIAFCDERFTTTFGKPIVRASAVEGMRVHWVQVARDGSKKVMSEIREIQHVAFISVDPVVVDDEAKTITQTTYEESLVSLVQEPECVTKVYAVPDLQVWKVRPGGVEFDAELLVNHIQSAVAPNSWRSEANPGADAAIEAFERNGSLVICQTKENHQAIAKMLNELRSAHGEEEVSIGIPHPAPKAYGKCAESQETLKCSAIEECTTEVKLAFGKRFIDLPNAEAEQEPYPIGECSTGFSVEPRCHDGQCTR